MRVIGKTKFQGFKGKHRDASSQVDSWLAEAEDAEWQTPLDIKKRYASASFLGDGHIIFNIKGNKYRLKAKVDYKNKVVLIKAIGTHDEYMKW